MNFDPTLTPLESTNNTNLLVRCDQHRSASEREWDSCVCLNELLSSDESLSMSVGME